MAASDQRVIDDMRQELTVPKVKLALMMRAVTSRIADVAKVCVRDAPSLAAAVERQAGTVVIAVRDSTSLASSQVFARLAPDVHTAIVDLQGSTSGPPPAITDWTLEAAVDKFGADVGARWGAARALVFTRRPQPQITVVPPLAPQILVASPTADRFTNIEEKLTALQAEIQAMAQHVGRSPSVSAVEAGEAISLQHTKSGSPPARRAQLLVQDNDDHAPQESSEHLAPPVSTGSAQQAVQDNEGHASKEPSEHLIPPISTESGQQVVPATPLQCFSNPQH